jgi:hypothetical protein
VQALQKDGKNTRQLRRSSSSFRKGLLVLDIYSYSEMKKKNQVKKKEMITGIFLTKYLRYEPQYT